MDSDGYDEDVLHGFLFPWHHGHLLMFFVLQVNAFRREQFL